MKKNLFVLVVAITFAAGVNSYGQNKSQQRPNVLFISIDDLNNWVYKSNDSEN